MIPLRYPDSSYRRVSAPYALDLGMRERVLLHGRVSRRPRRQRFVNVLCACGTERPIELKAWLHRPPSRCLRCHHESMRGKPQARRAA